MGNAALTNEGSAGGSAGGSRKRDRGGGSVGGSRKRDRGEEGEGSAREEVEEVDETQHIPSMCMVDNHGNNNQDFDTQEYVKVPYQPQLDTPVYKTTITHEGIGYIAVPSTFDGTILNFNADDDIVREPFYVAEPQRLFAWIRGRTRIPQGSTDLVIRYDNVDGFLRSKLDASGSTISDHYVLRIRKFVEGLHALAQTQTSIQNFASLLSPVLKTKLISSGIQEIIVGTQDLKNNDVVILGTGMYYPRNNEIWGPGVSAPESTLLKPGHICMHISDISEITETNIKNMFSIAGSPPEVPTVYGRLPTEEGRGGDSLLVNIYALRVCDDTLPVASSFGSFEKHYGRKHPHTHPEVIRAKYNKALSLFGRKN